MATAANNRVQAAQAETHEPDMAEQLLGSVMRNPQMAQDLMKMRMEHETILSECRVRPRDFETIKQELQEQIEAFPALAEDAIYCKPVGKEKVAKERTRDDGTKYQVEEWVEKFARGLSIRAAEVLAEAYGWNYVSSEVAPLDDDRVRIEASFFDYQKGRRWRDSGILSKFYKAKGGTVGRTADDRFYGVVCKAEASRRIREVILRCVNAGLKAWFEDYCERKIDDLLTDDTVKKIVAQFSGKNVTVEMLEGLLGRPFSMGITKDDRKKLLGVWNALKDGETTIAEVFGQEPQQPTTAPKNGTGSVNVGDLTNPKVAGQQAPTEPEKPKEEPPKQDEFSRALFMSTFMAEIKAAKSNEELKATAWATFEKHQDKLDQQLKDECYMELDLKEKGLAQAAEEAAKSGKKK